MLEWAYVSVRWTSDETVDLTELRQQPDGCSQAAASILRVDERIACRQMASRRRIRIADSRDRYAGVWVVTRYYLGGLNLRVRITKNTIAAAYSDGELRSWLRDLTILWWHLSS
jgi:hypothetical protein